MRLVNFSQRTDGERNLRLGAVIEPGILDVQAGWIWYSRRIRWLKNAPPIDIPALLGASPETWDTLREVVGWFDRAGETGAAQGAGPSMKKMEEIRLAPPVPRPNTVRDFYAFEQHIRTAREIRGQQVPEEWYRLPVFYYSNPGVIFGPGDVVPRPAYTREMDYELEIACVIGKRGKNLDPTQAVEHIAGYTILNDWSARDIQRLEARVGLGPAKAKDFATSLGPSLVTPDELAERKTDRPGVFDLPMKARVNGVERSSGNAREARYSFGEMLARASESVELHPGDVIGSGTVGTGCLLEITRGEGPWLQPGDRVELEIDCLGVLENRIGENTG